MFVAAHIIGGKKITKIITPGVVAAAQDHFGCNEIDGVPLEDSGDGTTSGTMFLGLLLSHHLARSFHICTTSPFTLELLDTMISAFPSPILSVAADVVKDLEGEDALCSLWARMFSFPPFILALSVLKPSPTQSIHKVQRVPERRTPPREHLMALVVSRTRRGTNHAFIITRLALPPIFREAQPLAHHPSI